jgi:hypothetical protein
VNRIPKLGIIAACQLDGSVSFYAVPHPKDIRQQIGAPEGQTIYCKSSSFGKGHLSSPRWALTTQGKLINRYCVSSYQTPCAIVSTGSTVAGSSAVPQQVSLSLTFDIPILINRFPSCVGCPGCPQEHKPGASYVFGSWSMSQADKKLCHRCTSASPNL